MPIGSVHFPRHGNLRSLVGEPGNDIGYFLIGHDTRTDAPPIGHAQISAACNGHRSQVLVADEGEVGGLHHGSCFGGSSSERSVALGAENTEGVLSSVRPSDFAGFAY